MRTLKQIDSDISQQRNEVKTKLSSLLNERKAYFKAIFDDSTALQRNLVNAESASMYGSDSSGIYSWYRIDTSKFSDALDELKEYIEDQGCFTLDVDNECIMNYQGPCIIINDDGDVLDEDSGKWIVSKHDYNSETERNALIEGWMEKQGYFPGVFHSDRHGNVSLVSTTKV